MATIPRTLRPGTRLDCNVRGRTFTAAFHSRNDDGTLRIDPPRGVTYHHVTAAQVKKVHRWDPYATQITDERS